jgi:hypothetical protein
VRNVSKSIHSPRAAPTVLNDPIEVPLLVSVPSDDLDYLAVEVPLCALEDLIDSIPVNQEISENSYKCKCRSICKEVSFEVLMGMEYEVPHTSTVVSRQKSVG